MSERGLLIVISGFSGAGKGTLVRKLMETYDSFALSISVTTREPREGEKDGVHYFFTDRESFEQMISEGKLYEYAEYQGNYYGTPKSYVDKMLDLGKNVILEIDVQGGHSIRKQFPDVVLVFVTAPSAHVLAERLKGRGTETEAQVKGRLLRACDELSYIPDYEYLLVNEDLDKAVSDLYSIVTAEHMETERRSALIEELSSGLRFVCR